MRRLSSILLAVLATAAPTGASTFTANASLVGDGPSTSSTTPKRSAAPQSRQKAPVSAPAAPSSRAAAGSTPAPVADADIERLRVEGFTALYSLDYAAAGKAFDELVRVAPDRPQGYLFRATNTWFASLFRQRLLSTSLYTQDEFYEQKEQAVDPTVDKQFRADLDRAISIGERRVAANPNDLDALYYLGAAHGSLAGYEASMAHAFMSALKHGSKSVDLHEKVLKLDPNYVDAYLSLGMYHYVVGSLPLPVKIFAAISGVRGSKQGGLEELERVVKEGKRNSDDARVILAGLYRRESRDADALAALRALGAKYPTNFVLKLEEGRLLADMKRPAEAGVVFEALEANPAAMAAATDYVEFAYGEALRDGGEYAKALARFERVWTWKGADEGFVTLARLGAGQSLDALGRRQEAIASYKIVLARPDVLDSRKKAEKLTKEPYAPSRPMASTGQAAAASSQSARSTLEAGWRAT